MDLCRVIRQALTMVPVRCVPKLWEFLYKITFVLSMWKRTNFEYLLSWENSPPPWGGPFVPSILKGTKRTRKERQIPPWTTSGLAPLSRLKKKWISMGITKTYHKFQVSSNSWQQGCRSNRRIIVAFICAHIRSEVQRYPGFHLFTSVLDKRESDLISFVFFSPKQNSPTTWLNWSEADNARFTMGVIHAICLFTVSIAFLKMFLNPAS